MSYKCEFCGNEPVYCDCMDNPKSRLFNKNHPNCGDNGIKSKSTQLPWKELAKKYRQSAVVLASQRGTMERILKLYEFASLDAQEARTELQVLKQFLQRLYIEHKHDQKTGDQVVKEIMKKVFIV